MKNKILVGFVMILSFCLVGCASGKETVLKCELSSNDTVNDYSVNSTYTIYSKGNEVNKVVTKEVVTSGSKEILDTFEKSLNSTYETTNKTYGGYTFDVKKDDKSVTSTVTIDYTKMDIDKFVKDNSVLKAYVNKKNKLTTEGARKIYTAMGATCEK